MVVVMGCQHYFEDHLENPYYPEYNPEGKYHLCNLCNGHDENYFTADNLEILFNMGVFPC